MPVCLFTAVDNFYLAMTTINGVKEPTFVVRRWSHGTEIGGKNTIYCKNYLTKFNQTWQAHVTITARCVTTTRLLKVKGQGHVIIRPRYIWRPGGSIILNPVDLVGSSGLSS